jgi:enediyne biosynthesis protein E3
VDVLDDAERARTGRKVTSVLRKDGRQVDFGIRRFRLSAGPQRETLETASIAFVTGFNAAISSSPAGLAASLSELAELQRGHALEGAGMAVTVLDLLTLGRGRRLRALLAGPGRGHPHLVLAGAGRGYASLRRRPSRLVRSMPPDRATHPALRWLAWDGYGFQRGFFASDQAIGQQRVPRRLTAEQQALFDQGIGRALWFHECADPDGVSLRIAEFEPSRRPYLWSGAGLAATYTGGADVADLGRLATLAGEYRADLACGSALACAARTHAGLVPGHTGAAAHALTGALEDEASGWVATGLDLLGQQSASPGGYLSWRESIREQWGEFRGPAENAVAMAGFRLDAGDLAGFDSGEADTADLEPVDATGEAYIPAPRADAVPARSAAGRGAGRRDKDPLR